jgi:RES domain-containing protein
MTISLAPLTGRFWRMLGIPWQTRPFDSGSHLTGGRWNPPGTRALYLSADYNTAIREMHQDLVRPGTLVPYDLNAAAVADLRDADPAILPANGVVSSSWRMTFLPVGIWPGNALRQG